MADQTPIMPPAAFTVSRNSHFGAHFCTHLMPALTAYTVAERDLEDVAGGYDPAYLQYEAEADEAREALTTTLIENLWVSVSVPTDRPMRRMVMLIDALVRAEDVQTFRGLHRNMHHSFSRLFHAQGEGLVAHAVNTVLIEAGQMVDALVALPIFGRWSDEELAIYHKADPDPFNSIGV